MRKTKYPDEPLRTAKAHLGIWSSIKTFCLTGDQEIVVSTPAGSATFFCGD